MQIDEHGEPYSEELRTEIEAWLDSVRGNDGEIHLMRVALRAMEAERYAAELQTQLNQVITETERDVEAPRPRPSRPNTPKVSERGESRHIPGTPRPWVELPPDEPTQSSGWRWWRWTRS